MPAAGNLTLLALEGLGRIAAGDDLAVRILAAADDVGLALRDGDVLAVAQKIVSKAEDRYAVLDDVAPSERARALGVLGRKDRRVIELVLAGSRAVLRAVPGLIVVEDRRGLVLANAGVDRSNVEFDAQGRERVLLLPVDPDASAARLRARIHEFADLDIGVLINDSVGRAWRLGTIGTAIGASGIPGLLDLRGTPDLDGRALQITEVGYADRKSVV